MQPSYVMTATVNDDHTLTLDEALPISKGKVRLIVEVLPMESKHSFMEVMEKIWAGQRARGHIPPTREEVDARIREERNSWDEE